MERGHTRNMSSAATASAQCVLTFLVERVAKKMWTRALWVSRPAAAAKDCASCGAGRGMQRGTAEWGKEVSSRSRMVSC